MVAAIADERVMRVLATVSDPEIPVVSIVDLGIVRTVSIDPPVVRITPTYTGCPATRAIEQAIRAALDEAGFQAMAIETVLAPPWTTDWISEKGRAKLLAYGIAPPSRDRETATAPCPRCGTADTREISRFGSTPCKSLWQCNRCLEPFDRFKCH
ncbi:1,2-phenylacetyl-CoA epoxidase subunit PaaD [Sphingomonas sp. KC8]|uniref:1,2-phenylacetyl-CoA epoxidase subunit PaaD n=1 Tax=Sphingomonas sp. KC8 TaxID=1030157 RepID=UPI000248A086|nr:1,2-phenylacetyl-CoA epoxidase subunit PaaD [Sphingomonas sp. KC8]ARS27694.1 phenylacetate-CoA oxygenase [Sphingomonas sp. KC8]